MCKSKPSCGCGCSGNKIREDKKKDSKYQAFFKKALKKFKVNDPGDFKSDAKKKEFYNWIDDNYKAKNESLDKWVDILDTDGKELDSMARNRQVSHKYNSYAKVTQKKNNNKPNATNYDNMDYDDKTTRQKKYGKSRRHEAYENAIRNLIRRELSAMNESSAPVATIRKMVREELNSTQINEARQNTRFNNWLKKDMATNLKSWKFDSKSTEWYIMKILEHTLRDANYHDLQKFLPKIFKGATQSPPRIADPIPEFDIPSRSIEIDGDSVIFVNHGEDIAAKAKWDGVDILNGFALVCDIHLSSSHASKVRSLIEKI